MNHLLRSTAPISDAAWKLLDEEAHERSQNDTQATRLRSSCLDSELTGLFRGWQL